MPLPSITTAAKDQDPRTWATAWAIVISLRDNGCRPQTYLVSGNLKHSSRRVLLYRTRNVREYGIGIATDQTDGTHYNDQNYGHHDRVFGDVLTGIF
jgi:hypothetical protein